jgi:hypothetical protein
MKAKRLSFAFISFHLLFEIWAFQRVTADSNRKFPSHAELTPSVVRNLSNRHFPLFSSPARRAA